MGKNFSLILVILVIILLLGIGYFIFQNQKLISRLSSQTSSPSPSVPSQPAGPSQPSLSPSPSPSPYLTRLSTQNAIKTNIVSKNYQGLVAYMTDPANLILQATECCGPRTPDEVVNQMSYINEGIPFDFNQESETTKNLKAKNPELAEKYIGISTITEHLIAFGINNQNKISDIRISVSWKLFNY